MGIQVPIDLTRHINKGTSTNPVRILSEEQTSAEFL